MATKTVLVVDDEPLIRHIIFRLLTKSGYQVLEAGDGVQALEMLAQGIHVDLLVVDIMMPRMDGFSLLAGVHRARPSLPAVVISGRVDLAAESIQNLGPLLNCAKIIAKPFTDTQLLAAVRTTIGTCTDETTKRGTFLLDVEHPR